MEKINASYGRVFGSISEGEHKYRVKAALDMKTSIENKFQMQVHETLDAQYFIGLKNGDPGFDF